jgi:hypothetical protein
MKFAQLFFPGDFEDAYVYMGWLNCISCDRTLRMYNVERLAERLAEGRLPNVAAYFFARNDWLRTDQFKALMRDEKVRVAFFRSMDAFAPSARISVEANTIDGSRPLDMPADLILDLLFYNSRLYLGTEIGMFDADIDWDIGEINSPFRKRHDGKCLTLSGGLGTINASCGSEGLFSAIDDFGTHLPAKRPLSRTANQSVRSGWLGYLLANYPTNSSVSLFHTSREFAPHVVDFEGRGRGTQIVTGISDTPNEVEEIVRSTLASRGISRDQIQYSFNSSSLIFYHTFESEFLSFHVREKGSDLSVTFRRTQKARGSRVLSAQSLAGDSLVIETDDRVFLFSRNHWYTLLPAAALSVRTFPRSKRFQNLICITTEEGIYLLCAIDDARYVPASVANGLSLPMMRTRLRTKLRRGRDEET